MQEEISQRIIGNLSEDVAFKANSAATYKALYEVTQQQLNDILKIIESNEELKTKFEEARKEKEE